jgi:hypothetical protein
LERSRPDIASDGHRNYMDYIFLIVTAIVGYHGLTFRDKNGKPEPVHMLFGCIAMVFFLRVLLVDVLKVF